MRNDYPRPQLVRKNWTCLNGEWDFEFDFADTLEEKHPQTAITSNIAYRICQRFTRKINLPFCPESRLSGIGYTDFITACWYRKKIFIKKKAFKRYLLHFQAAFHTAHVFAGNRLAAVHKGGYTPFTADITDFIENGEVEIKVHCSGDPRNGRQPSGKQSPKNESYGCYYTRCTGIWQTVWLEETEECYLQGLSVTPDVDDSAVNVALRIIGTGEKRVVLTAKYAGKAVGRQERIVRGNVRETLCRIPLDKLYLWDAGKPDLYDLEIKIFSQHGTDEVFSYFGMRKIEWDERGMILNGRRIFQRLVLDQGYYPEGIYTACDETQFCKDIERAMAFGFNGARLHEKVFEERFLYHADKLGYLVWGEYPSWGFDHSDGENFLYYLPEWLEAVERDYSHPSVIGWCPMNENFDYRGKRQCNELVRQIYLQTKARDKTRPVIDVSWNYHVQTDFYDVHDYTQQAEEFRKRFGSFEDGRIFDSMQLNQGAYNGEPFLLSEYGGFKWPNDGNGWGYNEEKLNDERDFAEKFSEYQKILYSNPRICGACYTQLYDVEQERNGLYYYDRTDKFGKEAVDIMARAVKAVAAYESPEE